MRQGGPADGFNSNMAANYPLRGMKRTLFEGGVRGVGLVYGAGLQRTGWHATGYIHAADWFHTLLRVGVGSAKADPAAVRALLPETEPPFEAGDGVDVWDYLSGGAPASPRTEVLLEAHPGNSTEGNGQGLIVGDLKVVIRSGGQWSTGSGIGSNDGWYGGPGSSDPKSAAYAVSEADVPKMLVQCPPPPADFRAGFACEADKTTPCLFNITADPCEHQDLSAKLPTELQMMLTRLEPFKAAAVSTTAHPNPDGGSCPFVTAGKVVKRTWMPCPNNGTHPPAPPPGPGPVPPGPPPPRALIAHGKLCLGVSGSGRTPALGGFGMGPCAAATHWELVAAAPGRSPVIELDGQCFKIYEGDGKRCSTYTQLHMGICRGDGNTFSFDNATQTFESNQCAGRCIGAGAAVGVVDCSAAEAQGWSLERLY